MKKSVVFKIAFTAIMSAASAALMLLEIVVPIMPSFIKFDFSDFPGLFTGMAIGPSWGVLVCLVKNLIHIPMGSTGGVGEIANFVIGAVYVFVASLIYKKMNKRIGILIGGLCGSVAMAAVAFPVNYYIVYPLYMKFIPLEAILNMYKEINPNVNGLASALLIFNTPFNVVKGLIITAITFAAYSVLAPLIERVKAKTEKPAETVDKTDPQ